MIQYYDVNNENIVFSRIANVHSHYGIRQLGLYKAHIAFSNGMVAR